MPSKSPDASFHLLRVRVKKQHFYDLQAAAMEETHATGEYTTVSDLVRSAIMDWLHINASAKRLAAVSAGSKKVFVPSALSLPPLDVEDDELREEAEVIEAETALDALDAVLAAEAAAYEGEDFEIEDTEE
jgi:Arc/MetJ-type ribon-helix-helix transcriptional regulator